MVGGLRGFEKDSCGNKPAFVRHDGSLPGRGSRASCM